MNLNSSIYSVLGCILCSVFFSCVLKAQSNNIEITRFNDNYHKINLDHEKVYFDLKNPVKHHAIKLIIIRSEKSTEGETSQLSTHLNRFDTALVQIHSFERKSRKGSDYFYFEIDDLDIIPDTTTAVVPMIWITSFNHKLLKCLKKEFNLDYYYADTSLLMFKSIKNSTDFFVQVNTLLSRCDSAFVAKCFATVDTQSKPVRISSQIGFNIGMGSFLQHYISASNTISNTRQSFNSNAIFASVNGVFIKHICDKIYLKIGADFLFYSLEIYNRQLNKLPIAPQVISSPSYSINRFNPLAKSNLLIAAFSCSAGYKIHFKNLVLNIDGGLYLGKSIYGISSADFQINQSKPVVIKNSSQFADKITFGCITNPNLDWPINKNCHLQIGGVGSASRNNIKYYNNYQFVDAKGKYMALERITNYINTITLGLTVGVTYNLPASISRYFNL